MTERLYDPPRLNIFLGGESIKRSYAWAVVPEKRSAPGLGEDYGLTTEVESLTSGSSLGWIQKLD